MQNLMERIRAVVGFKSWDYSVLWKLSHDHRFLEWMDCCCAGTNENTNRENGGGVEELPNSGSNAALLRLPCRDVMFQHPRTRPCDLLALLPSSIPLDDSRIHAEALISDQATWLNFTHSSDSHISEETLGTRVLIPVAGGLVELFVAKQVPQEQQVIDLVTAQCSALVLEHQTMINPGRMEDSSSYSMMNENCDHENPFLADGNDQKEPHHDIHNMYNNNNNNNSTMNFSYSTDNGNRNNVFFEEEATEMNPQKPPMGSGYEGEMGVVGLEKQMMSNAGGHVHVRMMEAYARSNSNSDSDINDEEEDQKGRRRTGKGPQSKNLMAERKRRKKLNDRLYNLRALVPKITKLDRASILGDAIEYVKELQKQVKDLQNELEEESDDEGANDNQNSVLPDNLHQGHGIKSEHENTVNLQQMEPQVEVAPFKGNEFFVKVFCEHKAGGFVRLMEALNSLGLEVTNVNATRHTCLVSNIFKVEKKDCETVQADLVRDSLLELTRNPSRGWPEMIKNGNGTDNRHQLHQNHHAHVQNYPIDPHHFHHLHN